MRARARSAAEAGFTAVAARLADAAPADGTRLDGDSLTPTALERVADEAISDAGADPAAATAVEPVTLHPGEPIVVSVAPRVDGARAPLARTFVVDGTGGWERRAAVAVEMAHDAASRVVEPGVPARRVVDEAVAELGAYGFAAGDGPVARALDGSVEFTSDVELESGQRFVLDPVAREPDPDDDRRVRVSAHYVVTDEGRRRLGSLPTSLTPADY